MEGLTDHQWRDTLLIPIAFAYILCVLGGERTEETGEVIKPPEGKERVVGLFLSGLRAISTKLKRANVKQFRNFIRILLQPFFKAWEIPAFT